MECGAKTEEGYTTSVTDLGNCFLIVRNIPCYKCTECNEIIYTGTLLKGWNKLQNRRNNLHKKFLL